MNSEALGRLRRLVERIEQWEDLFDLEGLNDTKRAAEELLLDIKQCLESILIDPDMSGIMEQQS